MQRGLSRQQGSFARLCPWGLWEALWFCSPVLNVWGTSQVLQRGTKINLPWSMRRVWSAVLEQSVRCGFVLQRTSQYQPVRPRRPGSCGPELSAVAPVVWEWTPLPTLIHIHFCRNGQPQRAVNSHAAESCLPSSVLQQELLSAVLRCKLLADALGG